MLELISVGRRFGAVQALRGANQVGILADDAQVNHVRQPTERET